MKLKEILRKKNKKARELAIEIGTDEPMISKFVNFKCLPTPEHMRAICKSLECSVLDIYSKKEVLYLDERRISHKSDDELDWYKLTVRLPNSARKVLASQNLRQLGYKDKTQWIMACYLELVKKQKTAQKERLRTITHQ